MSNYRPQTSKPLGRYASSKDLKASKYNKEADHARETKTIDVMPIV